MTGGSWSVGGITVASLAALLFVPAGVVAHCDTMDGPVVAVARVALESGDLTPVLKWVQPESEPELQAAFAQSRAVRALGPPAQELADMYFFETVVRLHRAGEGEPYTGLKPAGTEVEPAVAAADAALAAGSADQLVGMLTEAVREGVRARFGEAAEKLKHAQESVEAGREYVAAYVEFVHYAERIYGAATTAAGHAEEPGAGPAAAESH